MKVLITALFLLSFCCCDLYAQQSPWQLRKAQDGITVYTRKVAGSPILEYKADVIVNAPIQKAIALYEDDRQIPHWYYQCVHSKLVENDGPDQKVIYLILKLPWPVAPRDVVFKRTRSEDPVSGTISYSFSALPEKLPLANGMVRVQALESVCRFKPLDQGRTKIFFQEHSDPGGSIPAFITNQLVVQIPFNSLKNFRKLLDRKDAQS